MISLRRQGSMAKGLGKESGAVPQKKNKQENFMEEKTC